MDSLAEAPSITLIVDSRLELLSLLAGATNGICASIVEDKWILYQLELCVVEIATNIIVYAYERQPMNTIELKVSCDRDRIFFKFLHVGLKSPLSYISNIEAPETQNVSDIPESGRGIFLLNQFMDEISMSEEDGKNVISIAKHLKPAQSE
jgi:serine/threonine-protein kinase RsbW